MFTTPEIMLCLTVTHGFSGKNSPVFDP